MTTNKCLACGNEMNESTVFEQDHSSDNPRLHALYVRYAQEELTAIADMIEDLNSFHRVDMTILAGIIDQERSKLIHAKASYKEAAWRLLSHTLLQEEKE